MASFTDAIPQFNPYIQQLPVEAMMAVGMEKQRRYDEGVQRIQSSIDKVAGLDIVRDVDRQYLQGKLNQLGSKLKAVAAGDFSNYQLVNSVSGMAKEVANDNNVMSAVQATAKYRKEMAYMEKARQDGKSAIQNEYDFGEQTNAWMQDPTIGAGFNGRYREYIDVDKKWMEVMKSLHSDLLEEDIPYVKNADGSINYNQTAAAMQRMSKESVSAAKIENALRASLTPDEIEQLNINGRYQFRGYTNPEDLARYSSTRITSQISQNNKTIEELKGAMKLYASDPEKLYAAEQGIKSLQEMNATLNSRMIEEMEFIRNNPREAKGFIYRNGAIEQFAAAHAWEHQKSNLLTNPIRQDQWRAKEFALNVRKQDEVERNNQYNRMMRQLEYDLDLKESLAELGGEGGAISVYGGLPTNVDSQRVALLKDIEATSLEVDNGVNYLLGKLNRSGDGKVTRDQLVNALDAYRRGDVSQYEALIPNQYRSVAQSLIKTQNNLVAQENFLKSVREDAMQSEEVNNAFATLDQILENVSGEIINDSDYGQINFSPDEIRRYLSKINRVKTKSSRLTGTGISGEEYGFEPEVPLTEREQILHRNRLRFIHKYDDVFSEKSASQQVINDAMEDAIKERTYQFLPLEESLPTPNAKIRSVWENSAGSLLSKVSSPSLAGMPGGYEGLDAKDAETALEWLNSSDKNNIQYKIITQGKRKKFRMLKGSEEILIPLSDDEAAQIRRNLTMAPRPEYVDLINRQGLGGGSTNANLKFEEAYFINGIDMPYLNMNVRADMIQDDGNSTRQFITLMMKLPDGTVYPLDYGESVDAVEGIKVIRSLTDEDVKQLYLTSPKIPDRIKAIIQNM